MEYVYGNAERVFINTSLGCNAQCEYCYLTQLSNRRKVDSIDAKKVIRLVESSGYFISGEEGTIVSIGCYSECLDKDNISKTKELLDYFIPLKNYIQLATKQSVTDEILHEIETSQLFEGQVIVYISMPIIREIETLEKGTSLFDTRIENIEKCKSKNIKVALYIKPFLGKTTYQDIAEYIRIVRKYKIPVIIGSYLSSANSGLLADVGETKLYEQPYKQGQTQFIEELKQHATVYEHSTDLIKMNRERRK